uniref:Apolipoprotein C-III n=1 Tax=Salvator merianae TaxID=96440 RepID=A0A8D0KNF3_SALMN
MRGVLLLLFVLLGLLTTFAWADAPQEESLVSKVQVYLQQATQKAQDRLATIQESEVVQQASEWFRSRISDAEDFASGVKDKIINLFRKPTNQA